MRPAASQPAGSVRSSEKPPRGSVQLVPSGMWRSERLEERGAAAVVLPGDPRDVAVQQAPLAEPVHGRLDERARPEIGELLGRAEPLHDGRRRHEPPEPEPREEDLGERADVEDEPVPVQRAKRKRPPVAVVEAAVEAVLDDRDMVPRRDVQHPPRRFGRHRDPSRVVGGRLAVEELRPVARQDLLERLGRRPLAVPGHGHELGARRPEHSDRARIGRLLHGHDVAGIDEGPRDQVEALLRAVDHQDVVGPRLDAEPQEVRREVRAKRQVAVAARRVLEERRPFGAHDLVQHSAEGVGRKEPAVRRALGKRDHAPARPAGRTPGAPPPPPRCARSARTSGTSRAEPARAPAARAPDRRRGRPPRTSPAPRAPGPGPPATSSS